MLPAKVQQLLFGQARCNSRICCTNNLKVRMKVIHLVEDRCVLRTQAGALRSYCILLAVHRSKLRLQRDGPRVQVRHLHDRSEAHQKCMHQANTQVVGCRGS
jgi:hypothetical protein